VIAIVPYDSTWPAQFEAIAEPIASALGPLAVRVDHIGSTAVPGLAAKDIIDLQVTVPSSDEFDGVRRSLEALGYTQAQHLCDHVPPAGPEAPEHWQKRFFRPPAGQRLTNLHVRIAGMANQRYALLFRDYLRANTAAAAAYEIIKRQLAHYHGDNIDAYYDIKDPACDLIAFAAEAWALHTGWALHSD